MSDRIEPVTRWLQEAARGDDRAAENIASWAYEELERLANSRLKRQFGSGDITLEPAALVNETFIKLLEHPIVYENRRHFFAYVSKVMLRVLIDYRRARQADKRGGDNIRVTLAGVGASEGESVVDALALDQALERLESLDARKAEVSRLRIVWGLKHQEIASLLGVAEPTIRRDWRFARAWLVDQLEG